MSAAARKRRQRGEHAGWATWAATACLLLVAVAGIGAWSGAWGGTALTAGPATPVEGDEIGELRHLKPYGPALPQPGQTVTVERAEPARQDARDVDVSVTVAPARLPADGRSEAAVLVHVSDGQGTPVADGTAVTLETTLGALSTGEGRTREGVVRAHLVAPARPGRGVVTARVGEDEGQATFTASPGQRVGSGRGRADGPSDLDVAAVAERARNRLRPETRGRWGVENGRYAASFDDEGLGLALKEDDAPGAGARGAGEAVRFAYRLLAVRAGDDVVYQHRGRGRERSAVTPQVTDNEARYRHTAAFEETYRTLDEGVQQRFMLHRALSRAGDLVVTGRLDTPLQPELLSPEEGVLFYPPGASGGVSHQRPVLRYSGALVRDARGRETYARLALDGRRLTLTVPGTWLADAAYPVVIDPMIGEPALVSDPRAEQGALDLAYNAGADEYLVVWDGYDTGGASADLQGQRVKADGTLVGDLIAISQAAGDQHTPAVTYNAGADEYLVAWSDYRDDVDGDVYGQRVGGDGSLRGDNFPIGATEALQDSPDVAYNPAADVYLAVWRDRRGEEIYVYGQVISATGTLAGANFAVYDGSGDNYQPRVAYSEPSGEFLVVWSRWWDDVYAQRLSGAGTLLDNAGTPGDERDPSEAFVVSDAAGRQAYPAVAAGADGGYLVAWRDTRADSSGDVYGQVVAAGGALSGTHIVLSALGGVYQTTPDVAYDPVGSAYLAVWRDHRDGSDTYGQAIEPTGALSGTNVLVHDGTARDPRLAAGGAGGEYLVAWQDGYGGTDNVRGRAVSGGGSGVGTSFPIGPVTGGKYYPWIAFNESAGSYLVVWEDYRDGAATVYGQRMDGDGQPMGGDFPISDVPAGPRSSPGWRRRGPTATWWRGRTGPAAAGATCAAACSAPTARRWETVLRSRPPASGRRA